jgi:hypothetical protein
MLGPAILEPRISRGLAVGDLFNDGQMDVVVENLDGRPSTLRNRGIRAHHWVRLELTEQAATDWQSAPGSK